MFYWGYCSPQYPGKASHQHHLPRKCHAVCQALGQVLPEETRPAPLFTVASTFSNSLVTQMQKSFCEAFVPLCCRLFGQYP